MFGLENVRRKMEQARERRFVVEAQLHHVDPTKAREYYEERERKIFMTKAQTERENREKEIRSGKGFGLSTEIGKYLKARKKERTRTEMGIQKTKEKTGGIEFGLTNPNVFDIKVKK